MNAPNPKSKKHPSTDYDSEHAADGNQSGSGPGQDAPMSKKKDGEARNNKLQTQNNQERRACQEL